LTNIDNELYNCYSSEFHTHLPFDRLCLWFVLAMQLQVMFLCVRVPVCAVLNFVNACFLMIEKTSST
jgi:hypothetical protein